MPADGRGDRGPAAVEGDGHEIEPEGLLEHFAGEVAGRSEPGMGVAVLAWAGFHPGDELLQVGRRNGGMHQQHLRRYAHKRYRREVGRGVEAELGEQARIDDECAADDEDGIAVGRRLRCQRGADIAAATGMVLHVELLAEPFGQLGREHARHSVDRAARREWRDHLHRPIEIAGVCAKLAPAIISAARPSTIAFISAFPPRRPRDHSILRGMRRSKLRSRSSAQSALMLASWTTLLHFAISSLIRAPNSSGILATGAKPNASKRSLTSDAATAFAMSPRQ